MINIKNYYLLTFQTTMQLLKAEKEIKNKNIECIIVPTPRILSKSCCESIKIKEQDIEKIKKIKEQDIEKINYNCRIDHFINGRLEEFIETNI